MEGQRDMDYIGYVGTTSAGGGKGVYQIGLDSRTGRAAVMETIPMYNAGYLALSRDKKNLYALSEGMTFRGEGKGGITAYDLSGESPTEQNWAVTDGQRPCFVCCGRDDGDICVANFFGGTVSVFERNADGSLGKRRVCLTHPLLGPFGPAAHCVVKSPDGRYLLVLEISGDILYVYDIKTNYTMISSINLPRHSGPRHMEFSEDGKYVYINRQGDEMVSVYAFHPEQARVLSFVQELSVRTAGMTGRTEPAAIHICPGKDLLVVSNRGTGSKHREDSLSLFRVDRGTGRLALLTVIPTGGQMPRDFAFTPDGKFLLVAYQFQGYLDTYRISDDGVMSCLGKAADIPSPVCVIF